MSKSKAVLASRTTNVEQTQKLQAKLNSEQDLFDDIKNFANKWSSLEKEYSQSLSRLASSFKSKREWPVTPVLQGDLLDGGQARSVTDVWQLALDMVEKMASCHMTVSESVTTEVAEPCKAMTKSRPQESKKLLEVLGSMQDDVFQSTREMAKAKKCYFELEHEASICRKNHTELQDRLGNKSQRRFFESKAQLEKKFQALEGKLDISEKRSTQARNDYLLSIAGCNAVNELLLKDELPTLMEALDGSIYDKFRSCLASVGQITADAAQQTLTDFRMVHEEADRVERNFGLQCFLQANPVMTGVVRHVYSPYKDDHISAVSRDHDGETGMTLEARKLASRVAQCMALTETKSKEIMALANLHETYTKNPDLGSSEAKQSAEEQLQVLRNTVRRMRFLQCKAQARLDVLRECGIDTEHWLQSAIAAEQASGETKDVLDSLNTRDRSASMDDGLEASADKSFDDEFDEFDDTINSVSSRLAVSTTDPDSVSDFSTYMSNSVRRAVALYDYVAQTDEELSVVEGDEVTILLSSGDGWIKVQTPSGSVGYVPETYIEENKSLAPSQASSMRGGSSHLSGAEIAEQPDHPPSQDVAADATLTDMSSNAGVSVGDIFMVRALYPYEAIEAEELSFDTGAVIRLTTKDDNEVDDGWWEGELNGACGVFPSVVVEELSPEESFRLYSAMPSSSTPVPAPRQSDPDQTPVVERGDPFAVASNGTIHPDYV